MKKYIFILGQNPELSKQEIITIIKKNRGIIKNISNLYIIAKINIKPKNLINILGGTIKILEYQENINNLKNLNIFKYIKKELNKKKKNNFGFSIYNSSNKEYHEILKYFLKSKKELKSQGYKIRLVTSKEKILSSVIITKNNLLNKEIIIIKDHNNYLIGLTKAVQDFAKYGQRDMLRPVRDSKTGMLPPKLAQIMINLAGLNNNKILLDPFCGSGTILQEALLLGFNNVIGTDISQKAVNNSKKNTTWLKNKFNISNSVKIQTLAVQNLSKHFKKNSIDLIITEPFMGNANLIQKTNNLKILKSIKYELQELYLKAFQEFKKILSPSGKIVFIFPIINNIYTFEKKIISKINFKLIKPDLKTNNLSLNNNLIYARDNQKVKREITIWKN